MTNKATKYGIMIIAAVLLIGMAFAGAASATPYPLVVTNSTGSFNFEGVGNIVYGDNPETDGYVNLTSFDLATGSVTLELNGFNASNMTGNVPIIEASVLNLTIKLVGNSNLKGSYSDQAKGLIYSSGNMTITTESEGRLLVNNTASSNGNAIYISKDVTIEKGTIDVTGSNVLIQARHGNLTIDGGTIIATVPYTAFLADNDVTINNGTINAIATDSTYGTVINTYNGNVTINNGTVTATAGKYAISASKNVAINNGTVNAIATSNDGVAIKASKDVTIGGGTVNATATGSSGRAIDAESGSVTIAAVDQLIANGTQTSFRYMTARNFSALGDNYTYWVNATGSALPLIELTYEQFNASGNWTTESNKKSVYTNVTIKSVPPVSTYPIYITNASGIYQLNEEMTKVFGDGGNGYANLTSVAGDTYTLELNGFNASNAYDANKPLINASVPNLTIVLKGDSNLTGSLSALNNDGLLYSSGNLTITTENGGKLLVNNTYYNGYAIYAKSDVTINNGMVNATAFTPIYAGTDVTINAGTVTATVNGTSSSYAIWAKNDVTINNGTVNATATLNAIRGEHDVIINAGTVNATATGEYGYAIRSDNSNIIINNGTVTATATLNAIYTSSGSVIINDGTVTATATGVNGNVICASAYLTINKGTVTATATGENSKAIIARDGVTINNGTVTATADAYAIWSDSGFVCITSVDQLIANGADVAFAYSNERNFSALGDNYEYWVNSTGSTQPTVKLTYAQFNASGNWPYDEGRFCNISVYTNVLIKKTIGPAPAPAYTPSSSSHSGGSVILQPGQVAPTQQPTVAPTVKPTVKPTAAPTENPAAPTVAPTANPTAQQTQASPAPILGLIAGLGAAAVLLRLRK